MAGALGLWKSRGQRLLGPGERPSQRLPVLLGLPPAAAHAFCISMPLPPREIVCDNRHAA